MRLFASTDFSMRILMLLAHRPNGARTSVEHLVASLVAFHVIICIRSCRTLPPWELRAPCAARVAA